MQKSSSILWVIFLILFLLPTPLGRILIDIAGGVIIAIIGIPIFIGGAGWISWQFFKSKISTCTNCGMSYTKENTQCPNCGKESDKETNSSIPASSATIDIIAKDPENC
tara:strand:+ start:1104 stop:1430 length:327 start_codon:yes stop_codon:yes gene_type:complete